MPSMIDASCPKCGKRFGWCGEMTDKPPCPRCGHADDPAELAKVQAQMDEMEQLILSRPTANICQRQRVAAGLTLRQAAKQLGIEPRLLSDIENGRTQLSAEMAQRMGRLYDCGTDPDEQHQED